MQKFNYRMHVFACLLATILCVHCKKEDKPGGKKTPDPNLGGIAVFRADECGCGYLRVSLLGKTATITKVFQNSPDRGADGTFWIQAKPTAAKLVLSCKHLNDTIKVNMPGVNCWHHYFIKFGQRKNKKKVSPDGQPRDIDTFNLVEAFSVSSVIQRSLRPGK